MQRENGNKNMSFPRNVVGNLPLSELLIKEEKQPYLMKQVEDPRTLRAAKHAGMTTFFDNGKCGFTLIELLVVVLIIGILAAVALPQYQKAVIKSRYATLKNLTHSIAQAQEVYYLANGQYATDFEELSVEMPSGKLNTSTANMYRYAWGYCAIWSPSVVSSCYNNLVGMRYVKYHDHLSENSGIRNCIAYDTNLNDVRNQVCKTETENDVDNYISGETRVWTYPN